MKLDPDDNFAIRSEVFYGDDSVLMVLEIDTVGNDTFDSAMRKIGYKTFEYTMFAKDEKGVFKHLIYQIREFELMNFIKEEYKGYNDLTDYFLLRVVDGSVWEEYPELLI